MGGYHGCDESGPLYPLGPDAVVSLVREGKLVAPMADEISARSKGDMLSKGVALLQAFWFVVQCIARLIEHLPLTNLEVMTLAYTVVTVAMYLAWWDKPLNISCAIRVPVAPHKGEPKDVYTWEWVLDYVIGYQDANASLHHLQRVPTFWAGDPDENDTINADIVALLVAMSFGAVHCIAWSYTFPSYTELTMWQVSAIAIIAIPAGILLGLLPDTVDYVGVFLLLVLSFIGVPLYICARMVLLVLSFTTLKSLPYAVYHTVQWTELIPHI